MSLVVAAVLGLLPGCDSMSFTPPRPAGLIGTPGEAAPLTTATATSASSADSSSTAPKASSASRTRLIELLVAQPPNVDRGFLAQSLRIDAGVNKCGFRFTGQGLKKPMTAAELAAAIRASESRSTGALILEPIDAPEVRSALHEVAAKGLSIVLLDTAIPALSPGKYYPSVTFTGFTEAGKQVVDAMIEDARHLKLPEDAPILLLEYREKDPYSRQRLESLISALKAAGRRHDVVTFAGQEEAEEAALKYLNDHPQANIILTDFDFGIAGVYQAFTKVYEASQRVVIRGGYGSSDARLDALLVQMTEALANRNTDGFERTVLDLALKQMEGKPVPERVEVPVRFIRNPQRTPMKRNPVARDPRDLTPLPKS